MMRMVVHELGLVYNNCFCCPYMCCDCEWATYDNDKLYIIDIANTHMGWVYTL